MTRSFEDQITQALAGAGGDAAPFDGEMTVTGQGRLPSWFAVDALAQASVCAAAAEQAAWSGARRVTVDRRLAQMGFSLTVRPQGWQIPGTWDAIAGDYACADGWIRLHTNAPHHRAAALSVLACPGEREAVAQAVAGWEKEALETAIVSAGGAAAAMHSLAQWAAHPQGASVAQEPLIAWDTVPGPALVDTGGPIRVLDLTRVLAGPVATRFLAGFGAQVLRIDPPDWSEPAVEAEVTLGKRRTGLDLKASEDRGVFERLLAQADVIVHGYRADALDRLGFGLKARRALNPGLIDVRLNAFGWTGPWVARRGFDSLVQMSCGIAAEGMTRSGGDRPVPLPVQALDFATGYLMAASVLRALRLRRESGLVAAARLSLARTAHLLIGGGTAPPASDWARETPKDLGPEPEQTGWGPALRVRSPVLLDGRGPSWPYQAGPLRVDAPTWEAARHNA